MTRRRTTKRERRYAKSVLLYLRTVQSIYHPILRKTAVYREATIAQYARYLADVDEYRLR